MKKTYGRSKLIQQEARVDLTQIQYTVLEAQTNMRSSKIIIFESNLRKKLSAVCCLGKVLSAVFELLIIGLVNFAAD